MLEAITALCLAIADPLLGWMLYLPRDAALFMLAMGLGYTYEKSGSLLQPIFMHALFNGVTVASALAEQAARM